MLHFPLILKVQISRFRHFPLIRLIKSIPIQILVVGTFIVVLLSAGGCANIIPPSGGDKDSLPPVLVAESPMDSSKNVTTNRFTFVFNEFIELDNALANVLVSPTPVKTPSINSKLRTLTVVLRDTLEPNTTYSFNFGSAIKDINEGNVFKDFSYVFSTGSKIDTYTLSGKVVEAQTGKIDSTLIVVLHKSLDDSAVNKETPRYIARLDAQGNFKFRNLPAGTFAIYVKPDKLSRFDETRLFAFADKPVIISDSTPPINLFAYVEAPKGVRSIAAVTPRGSREQNKIVRYTTNLDGSALDLLSPLQLSFDKKIVSYDSAKIILTNKDVVPLNNFKIIRDTSLSKFTIAYNWTPGTPYNLLIAKDAFTDSSGATLARPDTLKFTVKKTADYGNVKIRFKNLDLTKNPVLLIVQNETILQSVPLTQRDFTQKLFKPGEYDLRILYDTNKNGKWDAGDFFGKRRQPEIVISLSTKLSVRANWDNEPEITL